MYNDFGYKSELIVRYAVMLKFLLFSLFRIYIFCHSKKYGLKNQQTSLELQKVLTSKGRLNPTQPYIFLIQNIVVIMEYGPIKLLQVGDKLIKFGPIFTNILIKQENKTPQYFLYTH